MKTVSNAEFNDANNDFERPYCEQDKYTLCEVIEALLSVRNMTVAELSNFSQVIEEEIIKALDYMSPENNGGDPWVEWVGPGSDYYKLVAQ